MNFFNSSNIEVVFPTSILKMIQKFDYVMKIITAGDSAVGKTCFLRRFIYDDYTDDYLSTVSVDFMTKAINTTKYKVQLQLWDTTGQEIYKSIVPFYFKGAIGAFLVFDLRSQSSFENLNSWLHDIKELALPNCAIALIGNKLDLCPPGRQQKPNDEIIDNDDTNVKDKETYDIDQNDLFVPKEKAEEFARENNIQYFEVSAKTGENVQNAFNALIETIEKNLENGLYEIDSPDNVDFQNEEIDKKSCC